MKTSRAIQAGKAKAAKATAPKPAPEPPVSAVTHRAKVAKLEKRIAYLEGQLKAVRKAAKE